MYLLAERCAWLYKPIGRRKKKKNRFRDIYLRLDSKNAMHFHFVNFSCRNKKQYRHCPMFDKKKWQVPIDSTHLESH